MILRNNMDGIYPVEKVLRDVAGMLSEKAEEPHPLTGRYVLRIIMPRRVYVVCADSDPTLVHGGGVTNSVKILY